MKKICTVARSHSLTIYMNRGYTKQRSDTIDLQAIYNFLPAVSSRAIVKFRRAATAVLISIQRKSYGVGMMRQKLQEAVDNRERIVKWQRRHQGTLFQIARIGTQTAPSSDESSVKQSQAFIERKIREEMPTHMEKEILQHQEEVKGLKEQHGLEMTSLQDQHEAEMKQLNELHEQANASLQFISKEKSDVLAQLHRVKNENSMLEQRCAYLEESETVIEDLADRYAELEMQHIALSKDHEDLRHRHAEQSQKLESMENENTARTVEDKEVEEAREALSTAESAINELTEELSNAQEKIEEYEQDKTLFSAALKASEAEITRVCNQLTGMLLPRTSTIGMVYS